MDTVNSFAELYAIQNNTTTNIAMFFDSDLAEKHNDCIALGNAAMHKGHVDDKDIAQLKQIMRDTAAVEQSYQSIRELLMIAHQNVKNKPFIDRVFEEPALQQAAQEAFNEAKELYQKEKANAKQKLGLETESIEYPELDD